MLEGEENMSAGSQNNFCHVVVEHTTQKREITCVAQLCAAVGLRFDGRYMLFKAHMRAHELWEFIFMSFRFGSLVGIIFWSHSMNRRSPPGPWSSPPSRCCRSYRHVIDNTMDVALCWK